ncbi:MAG: di-trans,poly-cis-decaprenylcistransferase [Epsilonproteobacteria bacterium]|nr:di-trans,poly-cis-decaprenylcistransferase [Campylobacterota bacterium]
MNTARHIAIIMDGNGRWAKQRGMKRIKGHERGAEVVRNLTVFAADHPEIEVLTLYAFSTENWKRPGMEVDFLMRLLKNYLEKETETYLRNGVRFETIGDLSRFSPALQKQIEKTKEITKDFTRLTQVLALNYGSMDEIARSAARVCEQNLPITAETLGAELESARFGPVDILLRTGGEQRLSNFLLWQSAYAELFFSPTLWPDFTTEELEEIIAQFKTRHRRFGGI